MLFHIPCPYLICLTSGGQLRADSCYEYKLGSYYRTEEPQIRGSRLQMYPEDLVKISEAFPNISWLALRITASQ